MPSTIPWAIDLAEPAGFHPVAFLRVAHEAALHEDGGQRRVPDHVESGVFRAAVHRPGAPDQAALHELGEALAFLAGIKCLQAADLLLPRVVVVDAHENRVPVAVCHVHALWQRDEIIAAAGHHRLVAQALELAFQPVGGVEREVFFINPAPLAAVVVAAVAGVDHDRPEIRGTCQAASGDIAASARNRKMVFMGWKVSFEKQLRYVDIFE